ncbi:MAG: hypothetical protein PHI41_08730 [Erysipelotrichaceae bacterium]|nr:hypothetical protein [Erysipelotrichaceae bacterium]
MDDYEGFDLDIDESSEDFNGDDDDDDDDRDYDDEVSDEFGGMNDSFDELLYYEFISDIIDK